MKALLTLFQLGTVYQHEKRLTEETMSQPLRKMEYAVRGEVVQAADRIQSELLADPNSHRSYDHVLYTNVGNPQAVGQHELTWPREVIALCELPSEVGIDNPAMKEIFSADVIQRARDIKHSALCDHGTGAYGHSQGQRKFREDIAEFITERDGGVLEANPNDIFMTNGASKAIDMALQALLAQENSGLMVPVPQYPIYSAMVTLKNAHQVNYYLDEEKAWGLNMEELENRLAKAKEEGINVVGFTLINPGNPTGQVLSKEDMHNIVRFCSNNNLVLLSDEVYQENVYDDDCKFMSARRAAWETGLIQKDEIELISFHSTSKGLYGECGHRGGYMELVGIDEKVKEHIYKLASSSLCPNTDGQIMMDLMVRGPEQGTEWYKKHEMEKQAIFESLKRRSELVAKGLDSIPGVSCQPAKGSMYCFPSVEMPERAIEVAKQQGTSVDKLYALSLLEATGICVIPASGFGQQEGRHGFRTTFLPSEDEMKHAVELIRQHHKDFCALYS